MSKTTLLRKQKGMTMIEMGLVIIIGVVLTVIGLRWYQSTRNDTRLQSEVSEMTRTMAKITDAYQAAPDFTGLTTAVAIGNNVFPTDKVNGARTAVLNNYNGAVTVAPATLVNSNDSAALTAGAYDRDSCAQLPNKLAGVMRRIDVNGTTVKPDGGAVDPSLVSNACLANANQLTYYGSKS